LADDALTDRALACWTRASHEADVLTRHLLIGGRHLALHLAGRPLADAVLPALDAHPCADPARAPELAVFGWDEATTGVPFPIDRRARQTVPAWRRRTSSTEVPMSGERLLDQSYEGSFSVLNDGVAVHWTNDAARLPYWERAAPLIHVLHWWLRAHGLHVVHAGAVGVNGVGVLIAGPSGSGKSTTALACRAAGWEYVGDDYTVIAPDDLRVHHLYRSAKVARENEHLLSSRGGGVAADDRWMHFVDGATQSLEIAAVIAPTVRPEAPLRLTPLDNGFRALAAIAPSTISQLVGSGATDLAAMRHVCTAVPCYTLDLTPPPSAVPPLLETVIR
jgi:hypothetical protein